MAPLVYRDHRVILIWLSLCAALVALMVLIGGYTRLSGSGLSITEWKPIHGVIPPLSVTDWRQEFAAYQASPQYLKVNRGMTLEEFKVIFWPEFIHRLLARLIGAVFFIPLIAFALRRSLSQWLGWRLAGIFALGGLQGIVGWLMVKSGLIDNPQVSPLRLALHLSIAFLILGMLVWTILDVVGNRKSEIRKNFSDFRFPISGFQLWFTLLCLQLILGAFMAGLHAGLIYNTWPDMNGHVLPETWDNLALIQFLHRNLAVFLALGFLLWWYSHRTHVKNAGLGKACGGVAIIIGIQFLLGVLTLIKAVPLPLAMLHQMTGMVLFGAAVGLLHKVAHD